MPYTNQTMKHFYLLILVLSSVVASSQSTKKVFFIGNSYTDTHNIPQLIQSIAKAAGDQLSYTSHVPGGATLQQHNNNQNVNNTIAQGNWDYVVLQEQSQLPAFPDADVNNQVYPYATALSQKIKQANPCAKVTFYMTWGRKNGDQANCAFWKPLCTYIGMDDLLQQRYMTMATTNKGIVAPVAAVWRYLITNNPEIDLYSADESHPSVEGAMAAAYTFYTVFFEKAPTKSTFTNNLPPSTINAIKNAVDKIVYNNLAQWKIYDYDPIANFDYTLINNEVTFKNQSKNSKDYLWNFGDGNTSTSAEPTHSYNNTGNFTVQLSASQCSKTVLFEKTIQIKTLATENFIAKNAFLYPNPANNQIEFSTTESVQSLEIIDFNGKVIAPKFTAKQNKYLIDLTALASGVYYLRVKSGQETASHRFIKL